MTMTRKPLPLVLAAMLVGIAVAQVAPPGAATSPQACFTAPTTVGVGQQFTADASCSVNTLHVPAGLEYSWNFQFPNGQWVGPYPNATYDHTYYAQGTYTIRLQIRDLVTNDTATSSRTILVGPASHAPAWGYIRIHHDGAVLTFDTSYTFSGWACTPYLIPHPHMECLAPPPPTGFVGWQCPGLGLAAAAWGIGSSVNGTLDCKQTTLAVTSTATGDIYGPNAWVGLSSPLVNDIVSITCHARPVQLQVAPQPPYFVGCGDP